MDEYCFLWFNYGSSYFNYGFEHVVGCMGIVVELYYGKLLKNCDSLSSYNPNLFS